MNVEKDKVNTLDAGELARRIAEPIAPVCLVHGLRLSEHDCLYCCLCFRSLTVEECHVLPDGRREDVCEECAEQEVAATGARLCP